MTQHLSWSVLGLIEADYTTGKLDQGLQMSKRMQQVGRLRLLLDRTGLRRIFQLETFLDVPSISAFLWKQRATSTYDAMYEEQRHLIFQSGRIGPPQLDRRGVVTSTHFELLGSTFLRLPLIEAPLHHNDFQRSKMVPGFRNRYNEPGFQRSGLANNDEESLGYLRDDWVVCFCCCLHRKCSGLEECSG
ncbi:hypothetical protein RUM44_004301 [Polyplax serrata]|uniref:Uncharacterized protein n=1 Tax=Polyplax serrata TaxID=468196 RepID=A0ABR1B2F8_POLSC